jgi:hypothetical protein
MTHFRTPLVVAALLVLSACGGGGGSAALPSTGGSQATQNTAPANMVITIPPLSQQNKHFRPNYISAATQSMTVGLVSGGSTTPLATVNLTTGSSNCTTPSGGGLQCTVTVNAPYGTDTFAVATYPQTNGAGTALSIGEVQVTITKGGTTPTVSLDLNGVPVAVALVLGQSELPVGNAGSTAVIVQATDASGNLIIGPGLFSTPISLAVTGDTYHTLSLSGSSVTSPGQVVTLDYNGGTNVGSTITPSGSGMTGTPVSFNATGAVLNLFQYLDTVNDVTLEPYDAAALSNGNAAIATEVNADEEEMDGVAIASTTGIKSIYVGDTGDYYNPPESGETIPGLTVVHGMSTSVNVDELDTYDDIAASGTTVYYSGSTQTESAPSCTDEQELDTGTLGVLNSAAGTTTEYILQGYPGPMHVDSSGNVWFIEYTGYCGESAVISSEYAIGKFNGSTVTETPFSSVSGLPPLDEVVDMSISPDGSTMYIADSDYEGVYKVSTGSFALTSSVALSLTTDVRTVATGSDGTTAWFANNEYDSHYPYGYVPGTKAFSTANMTETNFPITYFEGSTMAYADGSFWVGSSNSSGPGLGRLSGLPGSNPVAGYYPPPADEDESVDIQGVGGGNGYVWFVDSCQGVIYSLEYGAPSSGTMTYTERRVGTLTYRPRSMMHPRPGHHQQRKTPRSNNGGAPISHRGSGPTVSDPTKP